MEGIRTRTTKTKASIKNINEFVNLADKIRTSSITIADNNDESKFDTTTCIENGDTKHCSRTSTEQLIKDDTIYVKEEIMEQDDGCSRLSLEDGDSPLPLDVQITEDVAVADKRESENKASDEIDANKKIAKRETAEEQSEDRDSNGLEQYPIKTELVSENEADEDVHDEENYGSEGDIKIAERSMEEGESADQDSDGLEELPVKTELAESENEANEDDLYEENYESEANIKVELLEESYEDRINAFLQAVQTEQLGDGENQHDGPDGTMAHFLALGRPKRRAATTLTCENCSAMFKYQSTYDYHVKSQCGTKMIAKTNQLVSKGKNQSFTCNVCYKEMCSRTSLMVHMRIHNGERPFVCDLCSRAFTQKAHLKDHMKIHSSGKPAKPLVYTCSECGEVFTEKKFLTTHMHVHFGDKIFDCDVCHKRFRTRSNLSNHKIIHKGKRDFSCTVCGREFLRRPSLDDHMKVHTKEKPFPCDICGKRFSEKNRRNIHVKRHTGELTQVCSVCDKKFACSYDLRVHQRRHTGEKPFSCNICGRMFNRKAIMETHMTIHTGRKDFLCTQCGEAFNRKSKLDVHLAAAHTGETFHCEICHRAFKCKAYLIPHLRTHFGQGRRQRDKRPYCLLCCQEFSSSQLLQTHLTQVHPSLFKTCPNTSFVKVESLLKNP